jgi:hypothetical protein
MSALNMNGYVKTRRLTIREVDKITGEETFHIEHIPYDVWMAGDWAIGRYIRDQERKESCQYPRYGW